MLKVSENPATYRQIACCDSCGLENLPKRRKYFFHCGVCRWDLCPKCGYEQLAAVKARSGGVPASEETSASEAEDRPKVQEPAWSRARREIHIPTEKESVCRAPLEAPAVVSDWLEGV